MQHAGMAGGSPSVILVGGVVVWLAGHAHLSCLDLRQWITIGVDIHSFPSVIKQALLHLHRECTALGGMRPQSKLAVCSSCVAEAACCLL
jgi:hypothetical protein